MTAEPGPDRLVVLFEVGSPENAHLVKNRLEAAGIPASLSEEMTGWQPPIAGNSTGVRLWVREGDVERARQLFALDQRAAAGPPRRSWGRTLEEWGWAKGVGLGAALGLLVGLVRHEGFDIFTDAAVGAILGLLTTISALGVRGWLRERRTTRGALPPPAHDEDVDA